MPALVPLLKTVLPVRRALPACRRPGPIGSAVERVARLGLLVLGAYLLAPLGVALVTNYWRSVEFERAVHPDSSRIRIKAERAIPDGSVALLLRDETGRTRRVIAEQAEAGRFVNARLVALDDARARAKADAHRGVDRTLEAAFRDRDTAIDRFADWFFSWDRSYRLLYDGLTSTVVRLVEPGDTKPLHFAVERDLKDSLMREYKAQVLRPEFRDPLVAKGFEAAAQEAHDGFRVAMAAEDEALQRFLARRTHHLEDGAELTRLELDWNAQRWKAPTYLMDGRGFDALVGLGWAGAGGMLGAATLGPVIDAALTRAFAGLGARLAAETATRLALAEGGAAAGMAFPAGGPALGAAIGVALGFGADYLANTVRAHRERPEFIAANREALDATVAAWRDLLDGSLDRAVDAWFDDARAALLQTRNAAAR